MCDLSFGLYFIFRDYFLGFSIWKHVRRAGKVGRDLKSNVSGLFKDVLVLKVETDFRELIRKKVGEGLCERGFWHDLFHGKYIDNNVMSLKIVYNVVSRL